MFRAEFYFEKDSFDLALYGDTAAYGFLDIIDNYGMTETANLANYYAGICFLRTGDYERALDRLRSFKTKSLLLGPMKEGLIGDTYIELGETEDAASAFMKAAKRSQNQMTTPYFLIKAGIAYDELGNYDKAIEVFNTIIEDYPKNPDAEVAKKYIARIEAKSKG